MQSSLFFFCKTMVALLGIMLNINVSFSLTNNIVSLEQLAQVLLIQGSKQEDTEVVSHYKIQDEDEKVSVFFKIEKLVLNPFISLKIFFFGVISNAIWLAQLDSYAN